MPSTLRWLGWARPPQRPAVPSIPPSPGPPSTRPHPRPANPAGPGASIPGPEACLRHALLQIAAQSAPTWKLFAGAGAGAGAAAPPAVPCHAVRKVPHLALRSMHSVAQ
ncbi:hypothetical protein ACCO45_001373 [Purpureocillium lilacinum]|uniref:Uncharacterized protein n=1 Tax=Purpureocillium lilacinum TaxID=33203 RepID=A0ACC4E6V0_PURLI